MESVRNASAGAGPRGGPAGRARERSTGGGWRGLRDSPALHAIFVLGLAGAWESLYLRHGLNALDEGWPLYAAMQVLGGAQLYEEAFFVFPPGHLLAAWIGQALDPPGLLLARGVYAAFTVALCVALYFLARRVTSPPFALLAAVLLAVAAPRSHHSQLLFGYRYLVLAVLAIWLFSERLRTGDARWMIAAGAAAGLALVFRLTPAFAAVVAIGVGVLAADPSPRRWGTDGIRFAAGSAAVALPVAAWFAHGVGWETLWQEVVLRPVAMTEQQSQPVPALRWPETASRQVLRDSFVTWQFRLYALLYLVYGIALGVQGGRALRAGRRFEHPLLLAVVVFGGVYFLRAFGRADEPHIDSTLPPVCLLLAHATAVLVRRLRLAPAKGGALAAGLLALWVFLSAGDQFAFAGWRGWIPVETLDGATAIRRDSHWIRFDQVVRSIRRQTGPDDVLLDLSFSPLFHVASGRRGYGGPDVMMPGTFLDAEEERRALERLKRNPPALVVVPRVPFDRRADRSVERVAPRVTSWLRERYRPWRRVGRFALWKPREAVEEGEAAPAAGRSSAPGEG